MIPPIAIQEQTLAFYFATLWLDMILPVVIHAAPCPFKSKLQLFTLPPYGQIWYCLLPYMPPHGHSRANFSFLLCHPIARYDIACCHTCHPMARYGIACCHICHPMAIQEQTLAFYFATLWLDMILPVVIHATLWLDMILPVAIHATL